jgi:hypothetical protein
MPNRNKAEASENSDEHMPEESLRRQCASVHTYIHAHALAHMRAVRATRGAGGAAAGGEPTRRGRSGCGRVAVPLPGWSVGTYKRVVGTIHIVHIYTVSHENMATLVVIQNGTLSDSPVQLGARPRVPRLVKLS